MSVAESAGRPLRRAARKLAQTTHRIVRAVGELNYWQRRMTVLTLAPDRYLTTPNRAPETYREFLARTSGPLLCEPSSRARLAGRRVG